MQKLVLWRKYRPKTWSDLFAHEHTIQSLKNCLQQNDIPNAFLFYGIRGIGKTTIARILARCLSCTDTSNFSDPCGKCESCKNFDKHLDVMEIDAASKTGVDDIRELIEACQYAPVMGRYKIFIVDEVHMLSKSAFNALLKTIEEPPEHVKFIFATTELQKVPDTILSRCMVYHLKPINKDEMAKYLGNIAEKEHIEIESGVSNILAEASEGSVRDALCLLEQSATLKIDTVLESDVLKMLGQATVSDINMLWDLILHADTEKALSKVTQLLQNGADALNLYKQMQKNLYRKIVENVKSENLKNLLYLWQILIKQSENFQYSFYPEIILNASIVILSETVNNLNNIN